MDRAYSFLEIRSVDDGERVIEGIASTPTPDRYGDIVEPLGAKFSVPMPLLWQHRHDQPVGHVEFAQPTKGGIPFRARIAKIDEAGELKSLVDKAWQAVKAGLVRAVSIGFSPIEYAFIEQTGGIRFNEWEWLELSLVTIPANAEATIQAVKSIDTELRAALGRERDGVSRPPIPRHRGPVSIQKPLVRKGIMTYTEQIKDLEATVVAKREERKAVQEKVNKEGRTKDESERQSFEDLGVEVDALVREISDLRKLEKEMVEQAKPVDDAPRIKAASDSRSPRVTVEREEKLEPGIELARFAMCLAGSEGNVAQALSLARTHYPKMQRIIGILERSASNGGRFGRFADGIITRAAVGGGTTTDPTWASPLVEYNQFAGDFVEFLRPQTLIGQFGQNGVPDFRRIPFNVHIRGQTSGGSAGWVGQGKPKPVTKYDFNDVYHAYFKLSAISVITEELIRFSDPSAERLVRDGLAETVIAVMDGDFIDPAFAGLANVSPPSITFGVTPITSSGDDGDAVRADINALWAAAIAANLPLMAAVYITTPSIALALSLMTNALGQAEFPGVLGPQGGRFLGVPVITSNHVPAGTFILAFARELYLSDDGAVTVDASREASIQMDDAPPTQDATTGTGVSLVSMFQTNSVALRAERYINWSKRRSTAVAMLDEVSWGGAAES